MYYISSNSYWKEKGNFWPIRSQKKQQNLTKHVRHVHFPITPLWDRQCTVSANVFLSLFSFSFFTWTVNHLFVVRITNGGQVRTQTCRMKKSLLNPLRLQAHDMNTNCLRYALDESAERATLDRTLQYIW